MKLRAFNPDAPFDDPIRWLATVERMDGHRIDRLNLVELGHWPATRGDAEHG